MAIKVTRLKDGEYLFGPVEELGHAGHIDADPEIRVWIRVPAGEVEDRYPLTVIQGMMRPEFRDCVVDYERSGDAYVKKSDRSDPCFGGLVESPIGYYVSDEDGEKFERLLSDPFGRDL